MLPTKRLRVPEEGPLDPDLARVCLAGLQRLGTVEGRKLTRIELRVVAALRCLLKACPPQVAAILRKKPRKARPKAPKKSPPAPLPWPVGARVFFATSGRGGTSPMRPGTVTGYRRSTRGLWVEIWEDGAVEGVIYRTRPKLVRPQ